MSTNLAPRNPTTPLEAFLLAIPNPGTRDAYAKAIRAYAAWRCEPDELAVREFLSSSPAAHDLASRWRASMNSLSPHTVNNRLTALRALVKHCRRLGLLAWSLDVDSVRAVRVLKPGTSHYPALLAVATNSQDRAVLRLLGDLGLRRAECAGVQAEDFVDGPLPVLMVRGKGRNGVGKARSLAPVTAEALRVHLAGQKRGVAFRTVRGCDFTGGEVYRLVQRLAATAGILGRVHPHQLRSEAVDRALGATNGNVRVVADWIEHADVSTTQVYASERGREERSRSVAEAVALPEG